MAGIVFDKNVFGSNRDIDSNGYLRVADCNITKAQVAGYLGSEIPNWKDFGLERDKIYYVLRPEAELKKAVESFNNLPLTRKHIEVDVDNVPKEDIIGSLGDSAVFEDGYLKNNLIVYDQKYIDRIENGKQKELSCGYRYTPVRESGEYNGQHYDFVMKDIIGNHVALVKEGRAGHDVMVSDTIEAVKDKIMGLFGKKQIVGDEFKESEHPRDKDGKFTSKGGEGSGGVGSIEHNGAKIDIKKDGKYADVRIYAPEGKKFKNGDTFYTTEAEADKAEELAKKIVDNEFGVSGSKEESSEKKDVFKSRFSRHTVRRDDPNYKAQLSAAKNDLKEAISAFEKNVENQEDKFKWIEQQRVDMAKADLEDLEKFEKDSIASGSKEESSKEMTNDKAIPDEQDKPDTAGEVKADKEDKKMDKEEKKESVAEVKEEKIVEDKAVDKRKLIDEIGGILKGKVDDELIRTIIKKAEEIAYNGSEAGKADDAEIKTKEQKEDFVEGVAYGEKKEKEEPKKLDSEHESEGMKKKEAEDKCAKDGCGKMAKDEMTFDIDSIKAQVREEVMEDFKAREEARKSVKSTLGEINVMAFDSCEEIYKLACEKAGLNLDEIASYKDAFKGFSAGKALKGGLALDATPKSSGNEECFKNIRV